MQFLLAVADGTIWNALHVALGIFSGIGFFIRDSEKPAGFSESPFHGWGREGKRQLQRRFLRKRGAAEEACTGFQRAEPSQSSLRDASSPERGSFFAWQEVSG